MKVVLFGATGKTGKYLIDEALRRGIETVVFARSGTPFDDARVQVVRGDLTDAALLRETVRGADAVLSALGPTRMPHPADLPITRATQAIVAAMKAENVSRLLAVSTGTAVDPGDGFDFKIWFPGVLLKYAMRTAYNDMIGLAQAIRESDLDWTMVRAAVLKDRPASRELNVGLYGHTKHSLTMSRADIAAFMFEQIRKPDYIGKAPGVSTRQA